MDDDDFRDLLRAVLVLQQNMELNYNAFRHTRELDDCNRLLRRLERKYLRETTEKEADRG